MLNWNDRLKLTIEEMDNKEDIVAFYFPETINFRELDGYINYTIVVINTIIKYGNRNAETKRYLRTIMGILSKISTETVGYEESMDFDDYKNKVSKVLALKIDRERIKATQGFFGKLEDNSGTRLMVIRDEDETLNDESFEEFVISTLIKQLDSIRLSKETKEHLISNYNCHIEIVLAVNLLITTSNYLCRCLGGFNEEGLFISDRLRVEKEIEVAKVLIKRIKNIKKW